MLKKMMILVTTCGYLRVAYVIYQDYGLNLVSACFIIPLIILAILAVLAQPIAFRVFVGMLMLVALSFISLIYVAETHIQIILTDIRDFEYSRIYAFLGLGIVLGIIYLYLYCLKKILNDKARLEQEIERVNENQIDNK